MSDSILTKISKITNQKEVRCRGKILIFLFAKKNNVNRTKQSIPNHILALMPSISNVEKDNLKTEVPVKGIENTVSWYK